MDLFGELWVDIKRFVGGIFAFFAMFTGEVRWSAPPWLRLLGSGASAAFRYGARNPRGAFASIGALLILGTGGSYLHTWYTHRPHPLEIGVTVFDPPLTDFANNARPQAARFQFSGSAAPLSAIGKNVTTGVAISPKIDGNFHWLNDRVLAFEPKADWPVGQKFTVTFAPTGFLADTARLARYQYDLQSFPFEATIPAALEFYQDPTDPNLKKVVATIEFTHPVDTATFEPRVHATLTQKGDKVGRPLSVHVSFDKLKGKAFVHTEPLTIPERDAMVRLTISSGVKAARGGPGTNSDLERSVEVPGLYSFLSVSSLTATIVDNERFEPDQVLIMETSGGVSESEIAKHVSAWLLPEYDPASPEEKEKKLPPHDWSAAQLVGEELLKSGNALKLEPIAGEQEYGTVHSFRFHAPPGRWIYLTAKRGMASFGGYLLGQTFGGTAQVPEFPPELKLLGSGALLSMTGDRKVSVYARDIPAVRFEIGRVLPNQLQHLVSQGGGRFERPNLTDWRFGPDNISELFSEVQELPARVPGKPAYLALDLARYFDAPGGGQRRGLFFLNAVAWDPDKKADLEKSDKRLILLTDLGIVVKDSADGAHDVFVQSIHDGQPVAGARVQVLGKNGLPVLNATTDERGHALLSSFSNFQRDRAATLYLIEKGGDQSFLPIGRGDRYLDFSRFDIGGISAREGTKGLSAHLFSDRGIYRPGDDIHAGIIVKPDGWKQDLTGVPIQITVTDARGMQVKTQTVKLDATGFREITQGTLETSPTGTWTFSAYVVKDGRPGALLGSTTVRVREFQPDRMKIRVRTSPEAQKGWVSPTELKGLVSLENLFGTPAADHTLRGRIVLTPGLPPVGKWREYQFFDPMRAKETFTDDLPEEKTDDKGEASFDFHLNRFTNATYRLHFLAEGFEAEGGRSVAGEAEVTVSPLPFLLGWKGDGDFNYVSRGSKRQVNLIAISPSADAIAANNLKAVLVQRKYVSVLTRQESGIYKYESIRREVQLSEKALSIAASGSNLSLVTDKPGDFAWVMKSDKDEELLRVEYTVAGQGNLARSLEKDAELQLTLKSKDIEQGGTLEVQIKAPFVGAGLITIERDKVYAWKWFKSDSTASVQTIAVPPELEGNGYVSVSFLRDINSDEVFMSPLSYGVAPFSISRASRTAKVTVRSPDMARPGDVYKMRYRTDRPAKIVVFAVDEGILRVAGYKTPDPLGYFFQKRALEVRTDQILDLVLPEYQRLMATAAPGGDAEGMLAAHLNPFKRRRDKPVAYWSGILDAGPEEKEVSYTIPDSFNGTLRVMAIAVTQDAIGTFEKSAIVRGDFVISPNVPSFAAPGDAFDVTVSVANNVAGSGKDAKVSLALAVSEHLELQSPAKVEMAISELREGHATFRVRATDKLGSGTLTFAASLGNHAARLATDLSVRPAMPYRVTFSAGHLDAGGTTDARIERTLHPEFRVQKAGISHLPLGLAHGLAAYLEKFPHGCTEQLASQGIPAVALASHPEFGFDHATADKSVQKVIEMLGTRQNNEGAFGLWAASPYVAPIPSAWAVHFMLEARERGYDVPSALLKSALGWLKEVAQSPGDSMADERLRAYAIYLLTRSGMVTSAFAAAIEKRLIAEHQKEWKKDAAAIWLAGTYALLHDDKRANSLLAELRFGEAVENDWANYSGGFLRDAELLYVISRHFPERAKTVGVPELNALAQPIFNGWYNTLSSAMAILALEAYAKTSATSDANEGQQFQLSEVLDKGTHTLDVPGDLLPWTDFGPAARAIRFGNPGGFPAYWLVSQAGFDNQLPTKPIAQKLEVFREYTGQDGKPLARTRLGDEIQVHVKVRALGGAASQIAIVDLLPGGFEVVVRHQESSDQPAPEPEAVPVRPNRDNDVHDGDGDGDGEGRGDAEEGDGGDGGEANATPFALPISLDGTTFNIEYGDVREDRVVLYGNAETAVQEFIYGIKAVSAGTFAIAPIQGESLYDRAVSARGVTGTITVEGAANK